MIVDSSLWEEPDYVCKVFVTMLALKDVDHVCRYDSYKLAKKCHKKELEVVDALKILSSPDTKRIAPQEFEGRRIEKVEDGWLILNGEKFKTMMQRISRRDYQADWQREYRERKKVEKDELWPMIRAWWEDSVKNGSNYTEYETRGAFLALQANGWMWGKNPVTDHRAAVERQIQTDRERKKTAEKTPAKKSIPLQNLERMKREDSRV